MCCTARRVATLPVCYSGPGKQASKQASKQGRKESSHFSSVSAAEECVNQLVDRAVVTSTECSQQARAAATFLCVLHSKESSHFTCVLQWTRQASKQASKEGRRAVTFPVCLQWMSASLEDVSLYRQQHRSNPLVFNRKWLRKSRFGQHHS